MARKPPRGLFQRLFESLYVEPGHNRPAAGPPEPPPTEIPAPPIPPPAPPPDPVRARFDARLAELANGQDVAVAGKLQYLDLERLKATVGSRWEDIADKARRVVAQVITQRLAPGDVYTPCDPDGYLILFAGLNKEEARLKAEAISREVLERLIGEVGAGDRNWVTSYVGMIGGLPADATPEQRHALLNRTLTASAAGMAADPLHAAAADQARLQDRLDAATGEDGPASSGKTQFINLEQIKADFGDRWETVAAKARQITDQVIRRRVSPTDVVAPMDDDSYLILFAELTEEQARLKIAAIARAIQERLIGELELSERHQVKAYVVDIAEVIHQRGGVPAIAELSQILSGGEDVAPPTRATGADAEIQRRIGEVGLTYQPVWMVNKGVVPIFQVRTMRLDASDQIQTGAAAYPHQDAVVCFEIDREVLLRALHDLRRLLQGQGRAILSVPLRLQSLLDQGGARLIDLCRALPPEARQYLVIEFADLGTAAVLARLGEGMAAVQPFCRAVTARLPLGFTQFEPLVRHRITRVGFDLDDGRDPLAAYGQIETLMPRLAHAAHAHRIATHLQGIIGTGLARLARDAGFDYLSGPAIAKETLRPTGAYAYRPTL